ncbi:MAG: ABC transporter substrate-binding protein [Acidimicrobiales bacterium]
MLQEKNHQFRKVISAAGALACLAGTVLSAGTASASSMASVYSKATSLAAFGGMAGLVKAAKAEGELNVITLPDNWCNYGPIMSSFEKKYGIRINSENPEGSSQDEINAMVQLKGQSREPDVLDMGTPFAIKADQMHLLAPYRVAEWDDIPASQRAADATWWADYGGYVSIGYNSAVVKVAPTSFKDLLKPIYKHMVGINNSPTVAGAAFAAVYAAALANGGSFNNIGPGIAYFEELNKEGNFVPVVAGPSTVESGATPIVIWWDYLQASEIEPEVRTWKVVIPSDGVYASYYDQAISANAPHPAAARLWEEYLYSATGQNQWLQGYCRPIELSDMVRNGTVDEAAYRALPPVPSSFRGFPTPAQTAAAENLVAKEWSIKVSS